MRTILVFALVSLVVLVQFSPVNAQNSYIDLNPSSGYPGDGFTISGMGFAPGSTVSVYWENTYLGSTTAGPNSELSMGASVPNDASPGQHSVVAGDDHGNSAGNAYVVIARPTATQVPPTPTRTAVNTPRPTFTPTATPTLTFTPTATPTKTSTPDLTATAASLVQPTTAPQTNSVMLNVGISGQGSVSSDPAGISCTSDCSTEFDENTRLVLHAVPDSGFKFDKWNGCPVSSDDECTLVMTSSRTIEAVFSSNSFGVFIKDLPGWIPLGAGGLGLLGLGLLVNGAIKGFKPRGKSSIGPKQDDPLAIGPKQDDPLAIGPKQDDPLAIGPKQDDPLAIGPKQDDPLAIGPKQDDPLAIGPKQDDPLAIGPKQDDPLSIGPKQDDPLAIGPKQDDPLAIGPKQDDPITLGLNPNDPHYLNDVGSTGEITKPITFNETGSGVRTAPDLNPTELPGTGPDPQA